MVYEDTVLNIISIILKVMFRYIEINYSEANFMPRQLEIRITSILHPQPLPKYQCVLQRRVLHRWMFSCQVIGDNTIIFLTVHASLFARWQNVRMAPPHATEPPSDF